MVKALAIAAGSVVPLMGLMAALLLDAPPAHAQSGPSYLQLGLAGTWTCDPAHYSDVHGRVALGIWEVGSDLKHVHVPDRGQP